MVTKALVLSRTDWRDYDRMVTLLSPEHGRIDAVVRGCRKPKSPLIGAAERFSAGEFTLIETRGRFTVTSCQISESFYPLRSDVDRLTAGAYVLHLLLQAALPEQPAEDMFLTALGALTFLSYSDLPCQLIVGAFELHYLRMLGQAPRVDSCVVCGGSLDGRDARLDVRRGGAVCLNCPSTGQPLSNGARRILLRVPMTRFQVIDKLVGHPNLGEAMVHARRFLLDRLDSPPRLWPALEGWSPVSAAKLPRR